VPSFDLNKAILQAINQQTMRGANIFTKSFFTMRHQLSVNQVSLVRLYVVRHTDFSRESI
jgi:hypothetical protein